MYELIDTNYHQCLTKCGLYACLVCIRLLSSDSASDSWPLALWPDQPTAGFMDESSPLPRVSGDNSGALTPTNGPLKRSFDDLGTDDAVSSDGSGSSAQASNNGDSERNKRARSRSPPPPDVSEASRVSIAISAGLVSAALTFVVCFP